MKKFLIDGSVEAKDFDDNPIIITNPEGKAIGTMTMADYISGALGSDRNPQHDTMTCFDIGLELRRKKKAEVNETELALVKSVVKSCGQMKVVLAQMLRLLDAVKEIPKAE